MGDRMWIRRLGAGMLTALLLGAVPALAAETESGLTSRGFAAEVMAVLEGHTAAPGEELLGRLFMSGLATREELTGQDGPVTRLRAAQLLAQAMELAPNREASPFADVSDPWVSALYSLGLVEGESEEAGLCFRPEDILSVEEARTLVAQLARRMERPGTHPERQFVLPAEPEPEPEPGPTMEEKLAAICTDPAYPGALVRFAQRYPQVVDFVYRYPAMKDSRGPMDLSAEAASCQIPLLIQWDDRWGYIPFGDLVIGQSGCGPVCLSMVAIGLLQDARWTPELVCRFTAEHGYYVMGQGSAWSLMTQGAAAMGLASSGVARREADMLAELNQGHPIIASMSPGDFTKRGHFIVITGHDGTGFRVNDPNSPANSARTWSYEVLRPQIRAMWAMRKA